MRRLLIVLCLLVPSSSTAVETIDEASFGLWTAFATVDDHGEFWYCGLETSWPRGAALMLRFYGDGFLVQVTDPQWSLPNTDDLGSVIFRFGNGASYRGRAAPAVVSAGSQPTDTAFVDLYGDRVGFIEHFMMQSWLYVEFPNNDRWEVSLDGTYRSTMAIVSCLDLYRNYTTRNPFNTNDRRNPWQ